MREPFGDPPLHPRDIVAFLLLHPRLHHEIPPAFQKGVCTNLRLPPASSGKTYAVEIQEDAGGSLKFVQKKKLQEK